MSRSRPDISRRPRRRSWAPRPAPAGGEAPDFEATALPPIVEVPVPPSLSGAHSANCMAVGTEYHGIRQFRMGACTILLTRQFGRWHLSISRRDRDPAWAEVTHAWYALVPGAEGLSGALVLPPLHEYINTHKHCFHVHEVDVPPQEDPS